MEPPSYVHSALHQQDWQASKIPNSRLPEDLRFLIHGHRPTATAAEPEISTEPPILSQHNNNSSDFSEPHN